MFEIKIEIGEAYSDGRGSTHEIVSVYDSIVDGKNAYVDKRGLVFTEDGKRVRLVDGVPFVSSVEIDHLIVGEKD